MTVESNYVIAIATLNDWLKRLAPVFQPMTSKTKTNRAMYTSAVLKNFEFIVSERVQVNPDNSRATSALTFLLFKLDTLQAKIVKL